MRFCTHVALSAILAATSVLPILGAAAAPSLTRADYEDCQAKDETTFRTALGSITAQALKSGTSAIDYKALVSDAWRTHGLDSLIDRQVDDAVTAIRNETGWGDLLSSLADSAKAQELATAVAERVYRSDAMKSALENVALTVGKDVGRSIELATQDAAEPALACLKAFLGNRYGSTIAGAASGEAASEFALSPDSGNAEISAGAVARQTSGGIAGATILIVRRQLANMAARIGQRLVGSILSRLVSVAAGGVGLVLIAKDIWELRNGVLPIIATEMKSDATKAKVREEIAAALSTQIGEHVTEISVTTADRVLEIWRGFRRAHAVALSIAERDASFKAFLDTVKPGSLTRLDEVIGLTVAEDGEAGVLKRLADGSLNEAVNIVPEGAIDIARENRSLREGLEWNALAGPKLPEVVALELYRRTKPSEMTRSALDRILALDDRLAITRLTSLASGPRDTLLELDTPSLKTVAAALDETSLTALASYMTGLARAPRQRILKAVADDPGSMQMLASDRVRRAILSSRNQQTAVEIMLRPDAALSPIVAFNDAKMAWNGEISPVLIWEKHTSAVALAAVVAVLLLLWLSRLFSRRRPAPPVEPAAST